MHILLVTEGIIVGGVERFVLHQAKALQQMGHVVSVFIFYKHRYSKTHHNAIAPDIKVILPDIPLSWLAKKIDALAYQLNIDYSLRKKYIQLALRKTTKRLKPDVIHSNLLVADRVATTVGHELDIPVVSTIHGDYIQYYTKIKRDRSIPILNYKQKVEKNLDALTSIVCTSDTQINFFNHFFPDTIDNKIRKIYTGYEKPPAIPFNNKLKEKLNIAPGDFVFGQACKGMKEKGWDATIHAFLQLKNKDAHLVLVGYNNYLRRLKQKYSVYNHIHFVNSENPLEWINIFDVALFPTTYVAESLPTDIMDYLYLHKPVIASDAGEIKNMLRVDDKECGVTVPVRDGKVLIAEITAAMDRYMTDKDLYKKHQENTTACLAQFDMTNSINNYLQVYNDARSNKH